ncbi:conserved hypothetical protein [Aspergillus terreus NIH2624]|uniref:Major facilitator superfamily (MFS) profile domain-containing protein n=1 Tax=Aspergillus terreus (strain NIH 2624 / FGSC A1156) TaxID=341663 RepID=Q0C8J7_ASPTN|nr:uncharacterized protein ATEG_09987 [Aspergillus terreus NIH2624]EAU29436.1 conserved hypothetical protein [Aspergillus terreus NIH2624]
MGFNLHADNSNDPPEVRNWRVHFIAVVVSMGAIAMGYDTSVIGGTLALEPFRRDFGLARSSDLEQDTLEGNIVSTFQAGCFFGSLLTFPLAERFGRKLAIIMAISVFCVGGSLMTAASGHLAMIYTGRVIAGFGIGSVSLQVPVYIAETSPPSIRGRLVGIFEICSQGGGMCGFWINYIVNRTISTERMAQWQVPLGLQLLPGAFLLMGIFWCPETPRWYAKQDRWEEAERTLVWIRKLPSEHPMIQEELQQIREQIQIGMPPPGARHDIGYYIHRLWQRGTRNRIGIGLLLMAFQNLTGVNIITYYSPRIFETLGIVGTDTKLFATGFYGIAKTLGMVIFSVWLVEKVGRRSGLIWGAFIGSLPMWYIGGYVFRADPAGAAARGQIDRNAWSYIAMVCVYLYGMIYCATWQVQTPFHNLATQSWLTDLSFQGITWVICSEVFPIDIRMLCVSITTADQWLWSFIISRTTPYMITSLGYGTYFFFATLMVCMGFWAYWFIPETKGKTLEEMEALFGAQPAGDQEWGAKGEEEKQATTHVERVSM